MKTMTLFKGYNYDRLFGGVFWSLRNVSNWPECDCEPYEVEIPDGFSLGETVAGEQMFFKAGDEYGYELHKGDRDEPVLIGYDYVSLKVVGPVSEGASA
ncbi:MAG: hypothetical protein LUE27_05645 [Clostridia bacterium]|nr:hypothetical protein [Clostridia bacterium]